MGQVHDFQLKKRALRRLELQIELPEPLEYHAQALQVLFLHAAEDYDIVQVDHTICEVQLTQGVLHEMLECCQCITQPERHMGKLIAPKVPHREGHVLLRSWGHLDLPKAQLEIHR